MAEPRKEAIALRSLSDVHWLKGLHKHFRRGTGFTGG